MCDIGQWEVARIYPIFVAIPMLFMISVCHFNSVGLEINAWYYQSVM